MNIGLDIDGTITRHPKFFSILSQSVRRGGSKVYIVTSRGDDSESKRLTREELSSYGVEFDGLLAIAGSGSDKQIACPHRDLDWYQEYLWQKVKVCLDQKVQIVFEDDPKVIALFEQYAPDVTVFQVRQLPNHSVQDIGVNRARSSR